MITYVPYFYIIQHIPSGKKYAGCKYGKTANPSTFMKVDGYTTSSVIVNKLIELDGIDSFRIICIDTICEGLSVYDFETKFLIDNNCADSDDWLNKHNNMLIPYGSIEYKKKLVEKYGVEYSGQTKNSRKSARARIIKSNSSSTICCVYCKKETNLAIFGKYHSDKCKLNPNRNVNVSICPWCNFTSTSTNKSNMIRYHFDNCKQNPNSKIEGKICEFCNKFVKNGEYAEKFHFEYCKSNPNRIYQIEEECIVCKAKIRYAFQRRFHFSNCKIQSENI